eukprot:COSAG03_NODE_645_length_6513_cov_2.546999_2_plen_78_part_00
MEWFRGVGPSYPQPCPEVARVGGDVAQPLRVHELLLLLCDPPFKSRHKLRQPTEGALQISAHLHSENADLREKNRSR